MRQRPEQTSIPELDDPEEVLEVIRRLDLADQHGDEISKKPPVGADVSGRSASAGGSFVSRSVEDLGLLLDDGFVRDLMMTERTKRQLFPFEAALRRQEPAQTPALPSFLIEPPLASRLRRSGAAAWSPVSPRREPRASSRLVSAPALESLQDSQAAERFEHLPNSGFGLRTGGLGTRLEMAGSQAQSRDQVESEREAVTDFWSGLAGPSLRGWASEETVAVSASRATDPSEWPLEGLESARHGVAAVLEEDAPVRDASRPSSETSRPPSAAGPTSVEHRRDDDEEWASWSLRSMASIEGTPSEEGVRSPEERSRRARALQRGLASLALPGWGQSLNGQPFKARFFRVGAFTTLLFGDILVFRHALAGWAGALAPLGAAQAPRWVVGFFLAGLFSWLLSAYDAVVVTTNRR